MDGEVDDNDNTTITAGASISGVLPTPDKGVDLDITFLDDDNNGRAITRLSHPEPDGTPLIAADDFYRLMMGDAVVDSGVDRMALDNRNSLQQQRPADLVADLLAFNTHDTTSGAPAASVPTQLVLPVANLMAPRLASPFDAFATAADKAATADVLDELVRELTTVRPAPAQTPAFEFFSNHNASVATTASALQAQAHAQAGSSTPEDLAVLSQFAAA
ncbi:hypothetical protein HK101_003207, partial [Irineochytrium annulatum]